MSDEHNIKAERVQVTLRLDKRVVDYFKEMSEKEGIPYQNLINMYLMDCVKGKKQLDISFC